MKVPTADKALVGNTQDPIWHVSSCSSEAACKLTKSAFE